MHQIVDIRCPVGHQKLFGRVIRDTEVQPRIEDDDRPTIVEGNLLQFACGECKKNLNERGRKITRVLHQYNIVGEYVDTVFV